MSNSDQRPTEQPTPSGTKQPLPRWVFLVAVLLASLAASQFLIRSWALVGFPQEIRYGEAVVLDQARRVMAEPGLYPEMGKEPWLLDQYAPFYPFLAHLTGKFASSPFGGGRAISLLATLLSAVMLTLIVRRSSGLAAGLLCGAAMLTMMEFLRFGFLMRVDPLALSLAMVGVWCNLQQKTPVRILGAAAFFIAVYTRQTTVALLLVSYIQMWRQEGRGALRWPFSLLAVGLLFYGFLVAATDGAFHQHAVMSNLFRFEWAEGLKKAFSGFMPWRAPLFIGIFLALIPGPESGGTRSGRPRTIGFLAMGLALGCCVPALKQFLVPGSDPTVLHWILYGHVVLLAYAAWITIRSDVGKLDGSKIDGIRILMALASMTLIGRIGSDLNYLFEAGILMLLVCGEAMGRVVPRRALIISSLLAIQVLGGFYLSGLQLEFQPERLLEMKERHRITDHLEAYPDPVLSEEPWALAQTGRPLVLGPYTARQMYDIGLWDGKDLIAALDAQRYSAIVRAKQRSWAGVERDESGHVIIAADGLPVPYFGPWTFNSVRSLPQEIQQAIERNYQQAPGTTMIERVTKYFLEGREIWVPIPR
ncbi:MAG: hypothetical protein VX949_06920 [Planctomycetota bacterium]|nr:hypothetical protein [Planctomycetota bacterium]